MENINELKSFLVDELGWEEINSTFRAGNILVYFREEFKQWRIKDTSKLSSMDLSSIEFPLDDVQKKIIWRHSSENYKI